MKLGSYISLMRWRTTGLCIAMTVLYARYYRSWTGICFAEAHYKKCGDEYRITELRINNNPKEHELNDVDAAVALFYALLISEYGGYSGPYWKAAF